MKDHRNKQEGKENTATTCRHFYVVSPACMHALVSPHAYIRFTYFSGLLLPFLGARVSMFGSVHEPGIFLFFVSSCPSSLPGRYTFVVLGFHIIIVFLYIFVFAYIYFIGRRTVKIWKPIFLYSPQLSLYLI
jgi:hypothetical protein